MAELADALRSGRSGGNSVEVRVLSWAPNSLKETPVGLYSPPVFYCLAGVTAGIVTAGIDDLKRSAMDTGLKPSGI